MPQHIRGRLTTEPSNIEDLLTDIDRGEVKVPKFQRPFVWKVDQALALLDSLANGYPVGSVLLWRTTEKLRAERNIGDFALPETDDMTPTKYVLDGQQRLTVMYSSFGAEPAGDGFTPYYNLEDEAFESNPNNRAVHHFPLRLTYRTTELLNFRTALQALENHETLQQRLDALIGAVTGYRIPVVELRDLTVAEVCPIFERINSSGTKLSTFDLIAAATWTQEFDLTDQSNEIANAIEPKGFDGISHDSILKCIAAILLGSVKKEDVLSLRERPKPEITEATETVKTAILRAVDLLGTEFHITSMNFLPYEAQLICLVKLFSNVTQLSAEQTERLRQWFWRSGFAQHYKGASEAFVSRSLGEVRDWVVDGTGRPTTFGSAPDALGIVQENFHFRGAISKTFVLALARARPRNLISGTVIDIGEALSVYNKRQFHHIYPQAHLRRVGQTQRVNSLANICMLAAQENNRISDTEPTVYLPECVRGLGADAEGIFASAFLPSPNAFDYSQRTFQEFLDARSDLLASHIRQLCDGHQP